MQSDPRAEPTGSSNQSKGKLRIGIDFGTTYCAVAYFLGSPNSSETMTNSIIYFSGKREVKTQIAWIKRKETFAWGYEVDHVISRHEIPEQDRIEMLKLGLLTKSENAEDVRNTREIRSKQAAQLQRLSGAQGKPHWTIEDLITTYLEKLWKYIEGEIIARFRKRDTNVFTSAEVTCAISVPAIWNLEMCEIMINAAEAAGIPNADLVSEPEAAAASVLQEQKDIENQEASFSMQLAQGDQRDVRVHESRSGE